MWAGLYVLRFQRNYAVLEPGCNAMEDSISGEMYRTAELMVHASTSYYLACYRDAPDLEWHDKANLRRFSDSRGSDSRR